MNSELLRTELERTEEALLQSEEQLRQLPTLIDKACTAHSGVSASDAAKIVAAALALNERLKDRAKHLRVAAERIAARAR